MGPRGAVPLAVFPSGTEAGPFGRRLRRPRGARIPVTVVTGFLGAGKTTLVRALLEEPEGRGTAVVVNEFGEVGVDGAILAPAAAGGVTLLGGGCLCCVVRGDLDAAFRTLFEDRRRGAVPPFERVVLETSGADDPTPLLQTFLSDRALVREFHLSAVVAVVDAVTGADALATAPEARRQVAVADRIVLTKGDLATPDEAAATAAALRALNPAARVHTADRGRVSADVLVAEAEAAPRGLLSADAAVAHTDGLATFTLRLDTPVAWSSLAAAFRLLCDLRGDDLLRAKGLVAVKGCRGPVVF